MNMFSTSTQPLEIAGRILRPQTIQAVRASPSFHLRGWTILDRWALNCPEKLLDLEKQGEIVLLGRLLEQQQTEHGILSTAATSGLAALTDQEILSQHEIALDL